MNTASKIYVANAFSLAMLPEYASQCVFMTRITADQWQRTIDRARDAGTLESAIGHADTAAILGVPYARVNVSLGDDDLLLVAQLKGGRLPEGATTLPEGCRFDYWAISIRAMYRTAVDVDREAVIAKASCRGEF